MNVCSTCSLALRPRDAEERESSGPRDITARLKERVSRQAIYAKVVFGFISNRPAWLSPTRCVITRKARDLQLYGKLTTEQPY